MKISCIAAIALVLVLGLQCGCTKSNSGSGSNLKRNSVLEFSIVAEVDTFDEESLAAIELPSDSAGAEPNDLVKDANGVTIGRWVDLAREYAPEKETDQRAFKFVPHQRNFIRDGSTGKLIDLETFEPGRDFEQHSNEFKAWLDAKKIGSVQILCEQPRDDELVTGQHFQTVRASIDERGRSCAAFRMTSEGADHLHRLTSLNQGRLLGILINNEFHSAAKVESAISQNGMITGDFTQEEVDDLVINLKR